MSDFVKERQMQSSVPSKGEEPLFWNVHDRTQYVLIKEDRLTAVYYGNAWNDNDIGAVRTNRSLSTNSDLAYFEVTVMNIGEERSISVGMAKSGFHLNRHVGWEEDSIGYHSDGNIYYDSEEVHAVAEPFSTGDVIGCGLDFFEDRLFFTKNGKKVFSELYIMGIFYPTVGIHYRNDSIKANFGQDPFLFDVETCKQHIIKCKMKEINDQEIPDLLPLVKNYLLYYGFVKTLKAMEPVSPTPQDEIEEALYQTIEVRSQVREMIMNGRPLECLSTLESMYSGVFETQKEAEFLLRAQHFIELIKRKELEEGILYGRKMLKTSDNVESSPLALFVSSAHREYIADKINRVIIESSIQNNAPKNSNIEVLLRHLEMIRKKLRDASGRVGRIFSVHEFVEDTECI